MQEIQQCEIKGKVQRYSLLLLILATSGANSNDSDGRVGETSFFKLIELIPAAIKNRKGILKLVKKMKPHLPIMPNP